MTREGNAIVARGVTKQFGKKAAVNGVDFEVGRGRVCGLVGANGAGKTTTLSMLIGVYPPTQGKIEVLGMDPSTDPVGVRQKIGYVPEKHHLYDWMRVEELLNFAGELYPSWDVRERDRVIDMLRLPLDRRIRDLSRGELAKVALTVALSHSPELLILDEPTGGLDPVVRQEFLEAVIALLERRDRAVLFSSHILSDVERIADQVLILDRGRVVADTTIEVLRDQFVRLSCVFSADPPETRDRFGARRVERRGREWTLFAEKSLQAQIQATMVGLGATVQISSVSMEDAIVEIIRGESRDAAW